jgi:hypothetical protein
VALVALVAVAMPAGAAGHGGEAAPVESHGDPDAGFGSKLAGREPALLPAAARAEAAAGEARPCPGVDRTGDDAAHAVHPDSAAVIKVVYAHPLDVPNRLSSYAPVIEAGVKTASGFVAYSSGNTRSLRLDIGTSQGPQCLDIQRVSLPLTKLAYTSSTATAFTLIRTHVLAVLGLQPGIRNYLIYADGVDLPGIAGEAQIRSDDSRGGAAHARGGLFAVLYGSGGSDFYGSQLDYAPGTTSRMHVEVALHEITHNLGGVQRTSPNHTESWHCRDEWDLLCYDDDGQARGLSTFVACGGEYSSSYEAWDCNRDDYFHPNPAPGSYLDTHWNLFRSVFLCDVSACGSGWAAGPEDRRRPSTFIRRGPRRRTADRTPRFAFASDEAGSTFQCKLDRARYRSCVSPVTLRRLRPGRHTFRVRALDAADNLDTSPAVRRFRVIRR